MGKDQAGAISVGGSLQSGNWWDLNISDHENYIRSYGEGVGTASRNWLLTVIEDGESLLDVGCGPGCSYESFKVNQRVLRYKGIDSSSRFIEACRGLFPEARFDLGDALSLQEPVSSWDTVLLRHLLEHVRDWERALRGAFTVARRRVVIVLWRGLAKGPSKLDDKGGQGYCWDINEEEFYSVVESLTPDWHYFYFPGQRANWAWVLEKNDVIFDLDDFHDGSPNTQLLLDLKEEFPALKVTLFAIPGKSSVAFLKEWGDRDWVELAIHGWTHEPNTECKSWTKDDTHRALDKAERMEVFVRGFRAPGWEINSEVCNALAERGYWLAHHVDKKSHTGGVDIPVYWSHHPWMVHGHMQRIESSSEPQRNGLDQLCENGYPFHENTRFHFISGVL